MRMIALGGAGREAFIFRPFEGKQIDLTVKVLRSCPVVRLVEGTRTWP